MIITVDLETFYDRDYSLTQITTEEYIRDSRFQVIGMAVKIDDGETKWYPKPEVKRIVSVLPWDRAFVVCQNTAFDGAILGWKYGVRPKAWVDIMGMSRALYPHEKSHSLKSQAQRMGVGVKGDEVINALGRRFVDFDAEALARYGEYCKNDVELTKALFDAYMMRGFPVRELKLIDLTLRMFIEPKLVLDATVLQDHLDEVRDTKRKLLNTIVAQHGSTADAKEVLMSNPKFAEALRSLGVEPPMKVSPTTGKETYAFAKTDEKFKELLEHDDPRVQALVAARLGVKTTIEETRTERFIGMAGRGAFPVPLRYYGAHSGRWSGQDSINLQNLPSRGANAGKIKKAIRPPHGHVFIDCDSAQIEARTLAWLAGHTDLIDAFENKQDVYRIMAGRIYSKAPEDVTSHERSIGKASVLGCGYGVGASKLRLFLKTGGGVDVGEVEAKRIVDAYRSASNKIVDLWKRGESALMALVNGQTYDFDPGGVVKVVPDKGLLMPSGLYIQYPELRRVSEDGKAQWVYTSKSLPVKIYGGKVVENVCQSIARCVIGEQMLRISKRYQPVLTVHDAIAIVAPQDEADTARAYVEECMSWRPAWAQTLPLACESGMGATYGDC